LREGRGRRRLPGGRCQNRGGRCGSVVDGRRGCAAPPHPRVQARPAQRKEAGRGGGFVVKAAAPGFECEAGGGLDGEPAAADEGAALAVTGAVSSR